MFTRHTNAEYALTCTQAYAVTKAALIHLVKSLAVIAGPKIRVNSVAPGVLMTVGPSFPFSKPQANGDKDWGQGFPAEKIQAVQEKNVLKRLATPEVRLFDKLSIQRC